MNYIDWKPFYEKIKKDFNLDFKKDKKAAQILDDLLKNREKTINILNQLITDKEIIIFGAGPSIENTFEKNIDILKN